MPINLRYNADVGGEMGAPVQAQNPREAGMLGEGIASLGQGVMNMGITLDKMDAAKKKLENGILRNQMAESFIAIADEAKQYAIVNGDVSGKDYVSLYDKKYNESSEALMKKMGVYNSDALPEIQVDKMHVSNSRRGSVFELSTQAMLKYGEDSFSTSLNTATANVTKNPLAYDEEKNRHINFIMNTDDLLISPEMKVKAIKKAEKTLAETTVNSFQNNAQFDQARRVLNNKFASVFNAEERMKLMDKISSDELQYTKIDLANKDRIDKAADKLHKEQQEVHTQAKMKSLIATMSLPDTPERQTQIEEIKKEIASDLSSDLITPDQANRLIKMTNDNVKESSQSQLADIMSKKGNMSLKELNMMYGKIPESTLAPQDKIRAALAIEAEIKERKKVGRSKATKNPDIKTYRKLVEDDFTKKGIFASAEANKQKADALSKYDEYVLKMDPEKAADQVRIEMRGAAFSKIKPEYGKRIKDVKSEEEFKKIGADFFEMYKKKQLSKEDMDKLLKALERRKEKGFGK